MSGIIAIAPFFAFLTCVSVWLAFRVFRRKYPSVLMSRLGCAVPLLLFPCATVGFFTVLTSAMTETGTNTTPQAANSALLMFDVPAAATAVDFRHAFFSGTIDEATFTIDEADFLDWLKSNEWNCREFYTDEDGFHWDEPSADDVGGDAMWVWPLRFDGAEAEYVEIKNGYKYAERDEVNLDAGFNIVYDRDTKRAYVWQTTF